MDSQELARSPQPTMELYESSDGQGGIALDEMYQTAEDVVDIAQFAAERALVPDQAGRGAVVVMTESQRPDPATGKKIQYAYIISGRHILDPQTGENAPLDISTGGTTRPITIGLNWQSPLGRPTFPVKYVARPCRAGVLDTQRATAQKRLHKVSPTVKALNDLTRVFGRDPL